MDTVFAKSEKKLSYSQLKAFHNVALHGGFSRASEQVFLSQPALSEHVRRLEQDHDVLLFRREKKRVFLTETGQQLFNLTERFFEIEHEVNDFLIEKRIAVEGELRIVVDSACHISEILGRFQSQYPDVFISLRTSNTEDIVARLRAYEAELAIGGRIETSADLMQIDLGSTPVVAIAAPGYLSAKTRTLTFAQLAKLPVVLREKGSKTRELLEQEALRQRINLKPVMEVEGREAMREMVASGAGIGFISEAECGKDVRVIQYPIRDAQLQMQESLVYMAQRSDLRIIRTFVEFVKASDPFSQ